MVLLDTNALIWTLFDSSKISDTAKQIMSTEKKGFVSVASLWEIAIKQSLGKLDLQYKIQEIVDKCGEANIIVLPIEPKHLEYLKELPDIHKDPFDRLIIAQAIDNDISCR